MKKEGQQIRQYTLIRRLGRGGMGEVWLAETYGPLQYKKKFCIKTLLPEMREHLDYFATEARLGGWLTHTNLVNVIDFFEERGEFYIVQEYVEGLNFAELLAHDLVKQWYGRFPIEMAAFIIWSVLKGLYYAHTAAFGGPSRRGKLVHRDISTDNILLSGDAEAKLGDFGIAQVEEEWRKRTQGPNAFRGKPMNVSPEYLMGLELDARADLYQMALVLYEAVTGVHPFAAASSSAFSVMVAVREGRIQPTCQIAPWVDPALGALIDGLLQVDRDKRTPSDADTFRNRLYEVCPRLIAAERPLAELIRDATTRQRRLTSPLIRPEDMPHIKVEAPPMRDGVVLTATAEEPTAPLRMEHLAPMAVGGGASAAEHPARGGNTLVDKGPAVAGRGATRPEGIPLAVRDPSSPRQVIHDKTEMIEPRRDRRLLYAVGVVAAMVLLSGGTVYVAKALRAKAEASTLDPSPAPQQVEPAPAQAPPALPAAPAPAPSTPQKTGAAAPPPVVAAIAPRSETKRHTSAESKRRHATAGEEVGHLIVKREREKIRVLLDGKPIGEAPMEYPLDPGTYNVTLVRGTGPNEDSVTVPVKVAPGGHYRLNSGE